MPRSRRAKSSNEASAELVGVAQRLALLDRIEQARKPRIVPVHCQADALELGDEVRAAGLIGDEELALVADALGRDVLVGRRLLHDGGGMDARLGREGALADIGRVAVGGAIEEVVERARHARDLAESRVRYADLEALGIFGLELQRRNDGGEIGVAAAFAEAVERALDLPRAGAHRGKAIRHRLLGVVVGVNADMVSGNLLADLADDLLDLVRQRAAVGVAEHDPAGAGIVGGPGAGKRVGRVRLVAVEEMLAVEQHLAALCRGRAHAVADRGEVLLVAGLERDAHVVVPGFGDEADRVGLGGEERGKARIVRRRTAGPARHAECGDFCLERPPLGEQTRVDRIGAGIAGLDIVDAEFVEHAGDGELVGEREIDAVRLRAVAQRGVEQIKTLARHALQPE